MHRLRTYYPLLITAILLAACRKEGVPQSPAGTRLELSLDSLYRYACETYLWYEALPSYEAFNPRRYAGAGSGLAGMETALQQIASLAINPLTNLPYEYRAGISWPLYSYIRPGNIITGRQGEVLPGVGHSPGLSLAVVDGTAVYIRYVEQGSPADAAGLARGMKVLRINGGPAPADVTLLNDMLGAPAVQLTVQRADGSLQEAQLPQQNYPASPVLKTAVLTAGHLKAGYLALMRFSSPDTAKPLLDQAFAMFAGAGVTALVIDLRYNGGGYVETAEHTANLIAPGRLNGSVMYTEHFNALMQQGKAPILQTIPCLDANRQPVYVNGRPATYADIDYSVSGNTFRFSKQGALSGIKQVAFIVSGSTASAGELLINCLKPYMPVTLIGTPTYGKPVGFFGIGIDVYTVYLAQFRILNAEGQGDYFEGMTPDISAVDDVTHDFGDPAEACLSAALEHLSGGAFRRRPHTGAAATRIQHTGPAGFTGLIEHRRRLR